MKRLIDFLLKIYLLPLHVSERLSLYAKGTILKYNEHFSIAMDVIRRRFPDDTGVVIDIGAFDGDSTIYLAKKLPKNKILSFEPNPVSFSKARVNVEKYKNVELFNLAFSNQKGEFDFYLTKDSVSSSLHNIKDTSEFSLDKIIKVKVETLDSFLSAHTNILLIKLDVQGAELNILKEGKDTLKKTKLVLTEVLNSQFYEEGCMYYEVDQVLRENGFKIHSIISNYNYAGTKYFDVLYMNSI